MKLDFKAYIFDLDGCVYRGDELVPGAEKVIMRLRDKKKKILFLTNNSTGTPSQYSEKLGRMGIDAPPEDILTSSIATAMYMSRLERGEVYVLGEDALREPIADAGFKIRKEEGAGRVKYVVSGLDRGLTYNKLSAACSAILNGAKYIATNTDPVLPTDRGLLPGAGAISSMIYAVTGIKPTVTGKPSKWIISLALKKMGANAKDTAIIGDSLETDIAAGRKSGLFSILVLTGYSKQKTVNERNRPDIILQSIKDLPDRLRII